MSQDLQYNTMVFTMKTQGFSAQQLICSQQAFSYVDATQQQEFQIK